MATTFNYPFDPTGSATTNAVANERHVLSPPAWKDYYFIVPKFAPYFRDSLRAILRPSGRLLVEGVDYHCTHYFHAASHGVARRIYGSITMLDKTLTGVIEISYQTIGGDWVLDVSADLTRLTNTSTNPRITTWEEVVDVPYQFPPIDHQWDLEDLKGFESILPILEDMTQAIRDSTGDSFALHIADKTNPHAVTKDQVGLGSVQNYGIANISEAQAGTANNRYMTPIRTKNMVDGYIVPLLENHTNNNNNPHGVTKAQVGLSAVQNFGTATQLEAEAGLVGNKYMTPLQTKQAIAALATQGLANHVSDTNNPHAVTKTQVGLGSVENFPLATTVEAEASSRNDRYMTPLLVSKQIQVLVKDSMDLHINATNNPHLVTKTQVGLGNVQNFVLATQAEAEAGLITTAYMTPLMTRKAIEAIATGSIGSHLADANNPHAVTKAQVGLSAVQNYAIANTTEAELGQSNIRYMTPLLVKAAIDAQVGVGISGHVTNQANPHAVTKAQVGLSSVLNYGLATQSEAEAGTSNVKYMTPLLVKAAIDAQVTGGISSHVSNINNPHSVTAAQVGTYSSSVLDGKFDAKLGTLSMAADSSGLEGHTYLDVLAAAKSQGTLNSDKLGNQTLTQVLAQAKAQTAANSDKLGGKTIAQINSELVSTFKYTKQLRMVDFTLTPAVANWVPLFKASPVPEIDVDDMVVHFTGIANMDGRSLSGVITFNPSTLAVATTILSGHNVGVLPIVYYTNVGGVFQFWTAMVNETTATTFTSLSGGNYTSIDPAVTVKTVMPTGAIAVPMMAAGEPTFIKGGSIAAGSMVEVDITSMMFAGDSAAYDIGYSTVDVSVLDVTAASPTLNMYISPPSTVKTAIRTDRYVQVHNGTAAAITYRLKVSVPHKVSLQ